MLFFFQSHCYSHRGQDEDVSTRKALQTVAAGQKAENLLDFDDDVTQDGQPSGLAATTLTETPAAANLLAGTSTNPLDDLVSIFGGTGLGGGGGSGFANPPTNGNAFGIMSPHSAAPPASSPAPVQTTATQQPQDDLLGLF